MTIERDLSSTTRVYVDGVKAIADEDLLRQIEIYSQGELQEIATSSRKRLALIDRPHRALVDQWDVDSRGLASEIASLGPRIRVAREEIDAARRVLEEGEALRGRLREVRESRPPLSPEIASRRAEYQRREQLYSHADELLGRYDDLVSAARLAAEHFRGLGDEAKPLLESGSAELAELGRLLTEAGAALPDAAKQLPDGDVLASHLAAARDETKDETAAYFQALKVEETVVASIKTEDHLTEEVEKLNRVAERLETREAELTALSTDRDRLRRQLRTLRTDVFQRRLVEVDRINSEFSDRIVLSLNHGTRTEAYAEKLETLLEGSRLRERRAICQQIAAALPAERFTTLAEDEDAKELARVLNRDEGQMVRLISHLASDDAFYEIESGIAEDELEVTMFIEDSPRSVSEMSKGQRATAILPLLLRQAPYPLVLDQPEDDLDNRFVYETLVQAITALKAERQLIFVTHNANIPVIGNAENVLVMGMETPERATLDDSGTVDDTRDNIVSLLEGGERAFELRREVYGFGGSDRAGP